MCHCSQYFGVSNNDDALWFHINTFFNLIRPTPPTQLDFIFILHLPLFHRYIQFIVKVHFVGNDQSIACDVRCVFCLTPAFIITER